MTNIESGQKLIKRAEDIFKRDLKGALAEKDYNMVVRRAQEVVEFALKGALKILGVDYPKVHDVGFIFAEQARTKVPNVQEDTLERIKSVSTWLGEVRAPSFYMERDYTEEDAKQAFEEASFVLKEIKGIFQVRE